MVTTAVTTTVLITILALLKKILFAIGSGLCWIISFLTDVFDMASGLKAVTQKVGGLGQPRTLLRIFFGNTNINTIYWGMALIGIVMCIGFTIFAVIKKSGDMGDKMKQSMGDILKNCFKGITIILLMNFIISATITFTTTLLERINYLITNSQSFDISYDVTFDEDDYATMARSLNTIGNYSLNSSYNSRYNLNSCYNAVREDLEHLADKGKFDVTYITTAYDEDGESYTVNTWQSVLQAVYRSVDDISQDQPLDRYNQKLAEALMDAMDANNNDASFAPLERYHVNQTGQEVGETVHIDRVIMLLGTMYGHGGNLSLGSGMNDYYRAPYYYGQKDIFDYDQCEKDFNMDLGSWMYLTVIVVAFFFMKEMLAMVFNATARIFNMLLLYITAPPFIAVTPLDDGGKLKQWTTAFIIQSLGLFGTVISLRLVMLFIPILFNGEIQLFSSVRADTFARVFIMFGAIFTARKASGMIVGILADNAGWQAISAGDVGSEARGFVDKGVGFGKALGGYALGLGKRAMGRIDSAIDKSKGNSNGGGESKEGGEKGEETQNVQPKNMLALGSRTTAREVGPNGEGVSKNGSGTFSTTGSGAGVDYQTNNRPTLEAPEQLKPKSKEAEDINVQNRPTMDRPSPQADKNSAQKSSFNAVMASFNEKPEMQETKSKTFEDAVPTNRLSLETPNTENLNSPDFNNGTANQNDLNTNIETGSQINKVNLGVGAANPTNATPTPATTAQTNQGRTVGAASTVNTAPTPNTTNQTNQGNIGGNTTNRTNATPTPATTAQTNQGRTVGAASTVNTAQTPNTTNQTNQGSIGGNVTNPTNATPTPATTAQTNQGRTVGAASTVNTAPTPNTTNQTNRGNIGGNTTNPTNATPTPVTVTQTNQGSIDSSTANQNTQAKPGNDAVPQVNPPIESGTTDARDSQARQSEPRQNNNAAFGSTVSSTQNNNTTAVRRNKTMPDSVRSRTADGNKSN